MGTYKITKIKFITELKDKNIALFTSYDIQKIFDIKATSTLKKILERLKQDNIIQSLMKNKYLFLHTTHKPSDFATAQFLRTPSYISLESALSYYGLVDQFPYRISSITSTKSYSIQILSKIFIYSQVKKEYFRDYVKIDDFLIASRKKAVFDYLYFIFKGLRPANMIQPIIQKTKREKVLDYIYKNADLSFARFIKNHA
ncbi:MAG TPA: hypothetical protein VJB63_01080 [Patescibacteria group bacterium]|nr:hypothetical protein [Patescibacteria group bacterium]